VIQRVPFRPTRTPSAAPRTATEWEWARRRVEKKHKLRADVAAYVVINAFLIGAWAAAGFGYFWPGWVLRAAEYGDERAT
jgi:fatty acid desaturase